MKKVALLFIAAGMITALSCSKQQVDEYAMVTFLIGDVTKNSQKIEIGQIVMEKDILVTGEDSFCDLKIGESIIRIKEKSNVTLDLIGRMSGSENISLGLKTGKMLCKPKKLLKGERFLVRTPTAVAGVRGTKFSVEADKLMTTRIKVFSGEVKVAKRIKILDKNVNKILDSAPEVRKAEKVVVTKKDVEKAEKIVNKIVKDKPIDEVIDTVMKKARKNIVVKKKDIMKFNVKDFAKENKEIIDIKRKPKEVIKKIAEVIKEEKKEPKPKGRLLITRYEVYYIKNGNVVWEGKVVEQAVTRGDKLYIASGDYVFCASVDGPVFWRKRIDNDGKLQIREDKLVISMGGQESTLDLVTGEKL